jgi:glycerophosphoryl diester phosphodiesterase
MNFPALERLSAKRRPLVIAHRGASLEAPENTLPAFRSGVDAGSDLVELDYRHAADGVPIVIHDETLDRTTDALVLFGGTEIPIASKASGELERLDAGTWFSPRFQGTRLPNLESSLHSILKGSVPLVERKAGDAATLVALLERLNLIEQVVVQAFDWEFLRKCRAISAELALVQLGDEPPTDDLLDTYHQLGCGLVAWKNDLLTPEAMDWFHSRHIGVWSWTIDDPSRAQELVSLGVRGIITNDPARIRARIVGA